MKLRHEPLARENLGRLQDVSQDLRRYVDSGFPDDATMRREMELLRESLQHELSECLDDAVDPREFSLASRDEIFVLGEEVLHGDDKAVVVGFIGTQLPHEGSITLGYLRSSVSNGVTYPEHRVQLQIGETVLYCSIRHVEKLK